MTKNFYAGKKIFITGHTGFKGTWLCRTLLQAGAEITGFALPPETMPSLFEQTGIAKHINSINADVRDGEKLLNAVSAAKPEIVFHLAAQPLVRRSYIEPVLTYETNIMGTVNILEAVRKTDCVRSFVNITTDKVYENREWRWGYRENERLAGFDPYSNSKSCSDLITDSYKKSFFNNDDSPAISTARAGNVIGGGDYSQDRIIPDCVRAARQGRDIFVRNPNSIRPYQHILDCLSGYLLLAEKQYADKGIAGAYNFGPDEEGCVATGTLTSLFCKEWGGGIEWVTEAKTQERHQNVHEAAFLKLDCTKAKEVLAWKPRWTIQTAIQKTVEFTKMETGAEWAACIEKQIEEYFEEEKFCAQQILGV